MDTTETRNERDTDVLRKRKERSESARITIPECKNPARREKCLDDPERFLRTYFADTFTLPFGRDHRLMIDSVVERATLGGRQAFAVPRGRGKTEVNRGLLPYIVLKRLRRYPLPVAATTQLAKKTYRDFRKKFETNELLLEDFPEVCWPIRCLEGAPQRAHRQHVDGELTRIVWSDEYLSFPHVPGSPYGGIKLSYFGLDAAFRGANIDGDRPDFVLVDDPETRESAKSQPQSEDREAILDQDIAGLASQENNIAIVVLTTVQNRWPSLSFKLTDRKQKPAYNGVRLGMVEKWPDNMDLWERYVSLRQDDQVAGDPYGKSAVAFYLENFDRMNVGVSMLSDHFVSVRMEDGTETVFSAIQQAFNKIADTSKDAYFTEYQNDPPEASGPQGMGLSAEMVASRISGLDRCQLPANTASLTAAIDLGKYRCHWVVCAWWKGAGGCVVDYGVAEVYGTDRSHDAEASEPMIYRTLLNWRDELLAKKYVDASGTERKIDCVFVDSGHFSNAAYRFVKQTGAPFHASKGIGRYIERKRSTNNTLAGDHMHAERQVVDGIGDLWLFELDTDYWKQWVHERFMSPTFDESNMLRRGSLSLFVQPGSEKHTSFAHHITAEELLTEFVEGKGAKTYWHVHNDNNHWLDATYNAAAAGRFTGIHLLSESEQKVEPREVRSVAERKQATTRPQHGSRFRSRPGGWIKGSRRR